MNRQKIAFNVTYDNECIREIIWHLEHGAMVRLYTVRPNSNRMMPLVLIRLNREIEEMFMFNELHHYRDADGYEWLYMAEPPFMVIGNI